jgi:hypothetical protein
LHRQAALAGRTPAGATLVAAEPSGLDRPASEFTLQSGFAQFARRFPGPHSSYAGVLLTSDGRTPNCARKRLLKWDELLNPIEYAISVIDCAAYRDEESRS